MYLTMSSGRVTRSPEWCPLTCLTVGTPGSYEAPGQYSNLSSATRHTLMASRAMDAFMMLYILPQAFRGARVERRKNKLPARPAQRKPDNAHGEKLPRRS